MRSVHQSSKLFDIVFLQRIYGFDCSLIFINCMFCTNSAYRILDCILMCLKFFFCQISESLNICHFLQIFQSCLTLISSVIVCRTYKAVFYLTVCNYDLCIRKLYRCILKVQITCIEENRTILFTHCTCKLIHNTTVHSIEIIFGILSDKCKILHSNFIKTKQVS